MCWSSSKRMSRPSAFLRIPTGSYLSIQRPPGCLAYTHNSEREPGGGLHTYCIVPLFLWRKFNHLLGGAQFSPLSSQLLLSSIYSAYLSGHHVAAPLPPSGRYLRRLLWATPAPATGNYIRTHFSVIQSFLNSVRLRNYQTGAFLTVQVYTYKQAFHFNTIPPL